MLEKLGSVAPLAAWMIPGRPILSIRRLASLFYFRVKRKLRRDYSFSPPGKSRVPIDIYMPTLEKDAAMLEVAITYARKYILHPIGSIYIIAPPGSKVLQAIAKRNDCVFIDETSILGFDKELIDYRVNNINRNGWIYKMLINLIADAICKNRYILVLDADTCFIAPQLFLYNERPLFNLSNEYHQPYFDATERLLSIKHRLSRSFITHYMLFDAEVLRCLRSDIEAKWHIPWHQAIINIIDKTETSGFADYELYGDYYMTSGPKRPILNYWSNVSLTVDSFEELDAVRKRVLPSFRSVSLHNYKASFIKKPPEPRPKTTPRDV